MRILLLTTVVLALAVTGHPQPGHDAYDVNSYDIPAGYIKLLDSNEVEPHEEQSMMSSVNVKATLGMIEYLILLILLKGSLVHVADRYNDSLKPLRGARRRRRNAPPVPDPWRRRISSSEATEAHHLTPFNKQLDQLNF